MVFYKKLASYLEHCSYFSFIIVLFGILFVGFIIPVEIIEHIFNIQTIESNPIFDKIDNVLALLFLTVVIGPIIETLVFQIFLIRGFIILGEILFGEKTSSKNILIVAIFLAACIFGALHYYSIFYIIATFILGIYFGIVYYYAVKRNQNPFYPIFILHAVYNLTILGIEYL